MFRPGLDMAVIVRKSARDASYQEICDSFMTLADLQNIIGKQ
jgi:hypothetical protein